MRSVVRVGWLGFTEPLEGGVACFYNDVRGITTIAYGNMCNTPGEAAALPMVRADGSLASVEEKIAAWHVVHDDPQSASLGWRYAARLTPLRLTRDGMAGLALARLDVNDRILLARLPGWEDLSACAQTALHSLAWACGANVHFPRLFDAVAAGDFASYTPQMVDGELVDVLTGGAAIEIHMNEYTPEGIHNAGLVLRNTRNRILMQNAQYIRDAGLDPDLINWEHVLAMPEHDPFPSEPTITVLPDTVEPERDDG